MSRCETMARAFQKTSSRGYLRDLHKLTPWDARENGGWGLGLSIVKQIVTRLGGDVGFADAAGGGAIFYFELPVRVGDDRRCGVDTRSEEERQLVGERRTNKDRRSGLDRRLNTTPSTFPKIDG